MLARWHWTVLGVALLACGMGIVSSALSIAWARQVAPCKKARIGALLDHFLEVYEFIGLALNVLGLVVGLVHVFLRVGVWDTLTHLLWLLKDFALLLSLSIAVLSLLAMEELKKSQCVSVNQMYRAVVSTQVASVVLYAVYVLLRLTLVGLHMGAPF